MGYLKTIWKNRVGTGLNRFRKTEETNDFVYLTNEPDIVTAQGTPFSIEEMNKIEQGIEDSYNAGNMEGTLSEVCLPSLATTAGNTTTGATQLPTGTNPIKTIFQRLIDNIAKAFGDISAAAGRITAIENKIPNQASGTNQLADKDFVNSSINAMAAHQLTYNANGDPFPTKAAMTNAVAFYYKGAAVSKTEHDYCVVTSDESQNFAQVRYVYNGASWIFSYKINDKPFTAAQSAAIDSGATAAIIAAAAAEPAARQSVDQALQGQINEAATAAQNALSGKVDKITAITAAATPVAKRHSYNEQGQITGVANMTALDAGVGYGTCSTAAGTVAKVGTLASYVRSAGSIVGIKFSNANTATNPTLNVNSTGAAPIFDPRTGTNVAPGVIKNMTHFFQFDGTNWVILNSVTASKYYVSFKMTSGSDYLTFGLEVGDPYFADGINGSAAFASITINQFMAAMKTYFPALNVLNKVVTIGGVSGYWSNSYINHISLTMMDSTSVRLVLNTSNSGFTFYLESNTSFPTASQFDVCVSMLN